MRGVATTAEPSLSVTSTTTGAGVARPVHQVCDDLTQVKVQREIILRRLAAGFETRSMIRGVLKEQAGSKIQEIYMEWIRPQDRNEHVQAQAWIFDLLPSLRQAEGAELRELAQDVVAGRSTLQEQRLYTGHLEDIRTTLAVFNKYGKLPGLAASPPSTGRPTSPTTRAGAESSHSISGQVTKRLPESARAHAPPIVHRPIVRYGRQPNSGVAENFHSVEYPLVLLPFASWQGLHEGRSDGAVCSSCCQPQPPSTQQRKLFLVPERLSWQNDVTSTADRNQNKEALWAVNAELDLFEPAVKDEQITLGGRLSREHYWYPFQDELEAEAIMRIVAKADILDPPSWNVWAKLLAAATSSPDVQGPREMVSNSDRRSVLGDVSPNAQWGPSSGFKTTVKGKSRAIIESVDLTSALATPPSSTEAKGRPGGNDHQRRGMVATLQDFYSILDKIERTSPMGAKHLEAYADRLRGEVCKECWFKHAVLQDEELHGLQKLSSQPSYKKTNQSWPIATQVANGNR